MVFVKLYFLQENITKCAVGEKKKKRNTPNNSNTNYHREMKHIAINMNYYLFQFEDLKFVLGVCLHGGSIPNFNFFHVKPQI